MDELFDAARCYGEESMPYADTIKEFIRDELLDSRYYSILATKSPTKEAAKIFGKMSADELRHARRFSAAYYLITGKTYFPTYNELPPVIVPAYKVALRERYKAESRDSVKYPDFAAMVNDPCLKRLANNTGKDEEKHAEEIYTLIENI